MIKTANKETKPTPKEFRKFCLAQRLGHWDMLHPEARAFVDIEEEKYNYILHHYPDLYQEYSHSLSEKEGEAT